MKTYYLQIEKINSVEHIVGFSDNKNEIDNSPASFPVKEFNTKEKDFFPIGKVFKDGKILNNLDDLKQQKIVSLQDDVKKSKKIIIKNGNTLIINAGTPERKFFKENLESALEIKRDERSILSYWQKVDTKTLGFDVNVYIWRKVFKDLFVVKYLDINGNEVCITKSSVNKKKYNLLKQGIENASTENELNSINWNFNNPIEIDINKKANDILNDSNCPQFVKDAIMQLKGSDGQIHLIKEQKYDNSI